MSLECAMCFKNVTQNGMKHIVLILDTRPMVLVQCYFLFPPSTARDKLTTRASLSTLNKMGLHNFWLK